MGRLLLRLFVMLALGSGAATAFGKPPADPLGSPMWDAHAGALFGDAPVLFDPRVRVDVPMLAENQHMFPVTVDARGIGRVVRLILFADLNPIPVAVDFRPVRAEAFLATRIKLDQRTPVRGAVLLEDGSWHVWGAWVDAAGGGCSAPPVSRVKGDWAAHLGEMRGSAWPVEGSDATRLRFSLRHPMDTGYVENIATYHVEAVRVADDDGQVLGEMDVFASVSEDPAFTLMPLAGKSTVLAVAARDTNGRDYTGRIPVLVRSGHP